LAKWGGKDFLVCVDHWSGYVMYAQLKSVATNAVLSQLSNWFDILGWPISLRSDGGPQFRGPFSSFCEKHGIKHELAAPRKWCQSCQDAS